MKEPSDTKLSVALAGKVDEDTARRYRRRAQQCGMKDSQLVRLVLECADQLLTLHWKEFMNIAAFLDHVVFDEEEFNRLLERQGGFKRHGQG